MSFVAGRNCKAYYSSTAIGTTPATDTPADLSWTEIDIVREVTVEMSGEEISLATRGDTYTPYEVGLLDVGVSFEIKEDNADAQYTALRTAFTGRTAIALAFMDGAIATSGNEGLTANFVVTQFERSEPLDGGTTVSVTVKPKSVIAWYEVS